MLNDVAALGSLFKEPAKKAAKEETVKETSKDIWCDDEICDLHIDHVEDGRETPEYTINYRQSVASEDIFLGLSGKSHSIMNADELSIKVMLPCVVSLNEITLTPSAQTIDVRSTQFKLSAHLPHTVDYKNGSASWDGNKCVLTVILPIVKEYG